MREDRPPSFFNKTKPEAIARKRCRFLCLASAPTPSCSKRNHTLKDATREKRHADTARRTEEALKKLGLDSNVIEIGQVGLPYAAPGPIVNHKIIMGIKAVTTTELVAFQV
jgi:hypothetical protein